LIPLKAKLVLAAIRHETVPAHIRDHAVQRSKLITILNLAEVPLAATPKGAALGELLPEPAPDAPPPSALQRRSAWASTFVASLELAKQGEAGLEQETASAVIQVQHRAGVASPADRQLWRPP